MKNNSLIPREDFPKREMKKIQKAGKKYRKALSNGLKPVDLLIFQQDKLQNASWDSPSELHLSFFDGGVFFGIGTSDGASYCIGKRQQENGHILVIGSPGCHKTTGVILPSILTWRGTFVAVDIKGDISDFCSRHGQDIAYPVQIIDFSSENTWHYDPFLLLRTGGENDLISNARDLALAIIPLPNNIREPFWVQGAQNILTAIIL